MAAKEKTLQAGIRHGEVPRKLRLAWYPSLFGRTVFVCDSYLATASVTFLPFIDNPARHDAALRGIGLGCSAGLSRFARQKNLWIATV
jgi:hypothetical protein